MGEIKKLLFEYEESMNDKLKRVDQINETVYGLRVDYDYDFFDIGLEEYFNINIKED